MAQQTIKEAWLVSDNGRYLRLYHQSGPRGFLTRFNWTVEQSEAVRFDTRAEAERKAKYHGGKVQLLRWFA